MPVDFTKNQVRYRLKNPELFEKGTLRTVDIGRIGHTELVRGILKDTRKWDTQSVRISREDYKRGARVKVKKGKFKVVKGKGNGWYGESRRHAEAARKRRR